MILSVGVVELLGCLPHQWCCGSGFEEVLHKNHTLESSMTKHGNEHVVPFVGCID